MIHPKSCAAYCTAGTPAWYIHGALGRALDPGIRAELSPLPRIKKKPSSFGRFTFIFMPSAKTKLELGRGCEHLEVFTKPALSTSWKLGLVSLNKPKIACPWGQTDLRAPFLTLCVLSDGLQGISSDYSRCLWRYIRKDPDCL